MSYEEEINQEVQAIFGGFYDITPLSAEINDSIELGDKKIMADRMVAKKCAILCVDKVLSLPLPNINFTAPNDRGPNRNYKQFWISVRNGLEQLK